MAPHLHDNVNFVQYSLRSYLTSCSYLLSAMAAIIRLKRKACDEPAEGLVVSLKKTKCESSDPNEVLFKFAATLNSEVRIL